MDIEVKVDEKYNNPKIVIYTNKIDNEISDIIDGISSINQKLLKIFKDEKMYILNQNDIETFIQKVEKYMLGIIMKYIL